MGNQYTGKQYTETNIQETTQIVKETKILDRQTDLVSYGTYIQ